jgi:tetratricopeptide (TPR) repeat protein
MLDLSIEIVLLIVFVTWHYALRCGYISDDHAAVAQRKDIIPDAEKIPKNDSYWVTVFNDGIVMYYMTRLFWKLGLKSFPFFWHLFSLALHIANCYLLYIFLLPIFGYDVTLAAVAFWGINPMLNQNVVWVSGRPYTIGLFLTLIALICWQNPLIFAVYYMLAVITNISIFFAPIMLWLVYPESWQPKMYVIIMLAMAAPFVAWKFYKRFTKALVLDRDNFRLRPRKTNTFVRILLYYIWTLFVPIRMGWYHQAGFRYNERWEKFNYLTLIGYVTAGLLATIGGLPGMIYILGVLPNSNLYATNSFLQDRYLYFASIGIALLIAPYLAQYPVLFYCAITFYATRSYMYSRHMINDEAMYRENWRNHPNSDYAVNNLSYFLIQQHRYDEARVVILYGLSINSMNKMLWYNLGVTWAAQGHFTTDEGKFRFLRALDCWKHALNIEPRWSKPADDIEKLVKILIERKVLTVDKNQAADNTAVSIPALIGLKDVIDGKQKETATP